MGLLDRLWRLALCAVLICIPVVGWIALAAWSGVDDKLGETLFG